LETESSTTVFLCLQQEPKTANLAAQEQILKQNYHQYIMTAKSKTSTFSISRESALVSQRHSFGDHAFAIEATDGITTQKARPRRKHELLKAYGFEQAQITELTREDTQWHDTFDRLKETAPAHSWEPLLAALYSAKVEESTAETTRLYCDELKEESSADPKRHYTDSKVLIAFAETEELLTERTDHYGNDARVFTLTEKVTNRWTTLPLPTTETWINATEQEPDLLLVKKALHTNTTPLKAQFTNTEYYNELISRRFGLENGMIYQLEQPIATRTRQLQQKKSGPFDTAPNNFSGRVGANATSHHTEQVIGALSRDG
jgi:hypothetical protein